MFDVSFTELMIIGVVALVVIGPERLPRVARTLGHLVGRAQRYVSDVKSDIQREMELEQFQDLKGQMEEAAESVKSSMKQASDTLRDPLEEARKALGDASQSMDELVKATEEDIRNLPDDAPPPPSETSS
ncbi:MAG: Sec-independent protein translocase protein TatB [Castellaniella sp.]